MRPILVEFGPWQTLAVKLGWAQVRVQPMADLLIELVSEEIPARMQIGAGQDIARLVEVMLTSLGVWNEASAITGLCASRHLLA